MSFVQQQSTAEQQELVRLVRAAQQGDRAALEALFHRYYRAVYATVVRRLGDHAEAQELCQEVFLQAMRKVHQLHNPLCFGGWLRSVAKRMALNRATRGARKDQVRAGALEARCVGNETPLGQILARERRERVRVGLDRLTELDRNTLVAFYFEGQSLVQMSHQFRSPVGTIKRRLHVARKRLAAQLEAFASS